MTIIVKTSGCQRQFDIFFWYIIDLRQNTVTGYVRDLYDWKQVQKQPKLNFDIDCKQSRSQQTDWFK